MAEPKRLGLRPVLLVLVIALAASAAGLPNGFAYDDFPAIVRNADVHTLHAPWRFWTETYWPLTRFAGGETLYRPLTSLAFAVQWVLGNGSPLPFHLVSTALYLAACGVFLWLAWVVLPAEGALAAACLFAAHPVHVEAVGNVVGQSELLAALFSLLAVGLLVRVRGPGPIGLGDRLRLYGCYLLACLSKENGVILPGLLLAAEFTVVRDPRPLRVRLLALREFWIVLIGVGLCYVALRAMVIGTLAGDYPHVLIAHATYPQRIYTMLRVALEWPRLLLWPAHLQADYSPRDFDLALAFGPVQFAGVGMLATSAWLIWWAWRRRPAVAFGVMWFYIAIFLVSNLVFKTGVLLAERTLLLPSAGVMLALGGAVAAATEVPHRRRWLVAGSAAALTCLGVLRSGVRQPVWKDNWALLRATVRDAPRNYHAHWSYGLQLFDLGLRESAFTEIETAIDLYPRDAALLSDAGDLHRTAGECHEAIALYRRSLAIDPRRLYTQSRLASCYMRVGRYADARLEIHRLIDQGHPQFVILLPAIDSASAAGATAFR